jgi:formate transporter FocA
MNKDTLQDSPRQFSMDALMPPQMARKAAALGVVKAKMGWHNLVLLSILAGAFISLGAVFSTVVTTSGDVPLAFGLSRLAGGLVFSLGLILVVVAGAELFTGNNLIVMAWASKTVSTRQLLRNWIIVYIGNFIGAMTTAGFMLITRQYLFAKGGVGLNLLTIADYKCGMHLTEAFALGVFCNALVCLAVWLCYSCTTTTDKILAIIFPITAFVACGFEHSIANMYFIPMGLLVKSFSGGEFWSLIHRTSADFGNLSLMNFVFKNLIPVTVGNIFGGSVMVGIVYWFVYIRKPRVSPFSSD